MMISENSISTAISDDLVKSLRSNFQGNIFLPHEEGYDNARSMWNARFDKRPSLIAQCTGAADVIQIVRFARKQGLPASVRSGSHDLCGRSVMDGAISIDLSLMRGVRVNPTKGTVVAQAGAPWREVTRELQALGFAAGGPMDSNVTVTGYGLGGGLNLFMRCHGLACDNIVSLDVVTAEGELLTVDEHNHPDLFWAMRGAGANFGVVTSIEYKVYPIKTVIAGNVVWDLGDNPYENARELLSFLRDYNLTVPDEVTTFAYLLSDPESGKPVISIWMCYVGDIAQGEEVLHPLRSFGVALLDDVKEVTYEEQQTRVDFVAPPGRYYYYRTQLLRKLDDATLEALVNHYVQHTVPELFIILEHFGGAIARVPEEATAFAGRDADYCLLFGGGTDTDAQMRNLSPVIRTLGEALEPFATGKAYVNYLESDELERVPEAYGLKRYAKLMEVKKKYDPTNFFRFNQNIKPVSESKSK